MGYPGIVPCSVLERFRRRSPAAGSPLAGWSASTSTSPCSRTTRRCACAACPSPHTLVCVCVCVCVCVFVFVCVIAWVVGWVGGGGGVCAERRGSSALFLLSHCVSRTACQLQPEQRAVLPCGTPGGTAPPSRQQGHGLPICPRRAHPARAPADAAPAKVRAACPAGELSSDDDFYLLSTGLVVLQVGSGSGGGA